ncbi:MAG: hypothetical protein V3V75_09885, partial [Thermoguttaceae bacterium]
RHFSHNMNLQLDIAHVRGVPGSSGDTIHNYLRTGFLASEDAAQLLLEVFLEIVVAEKRLLSTVPPLGHMMRHARNNHSC